MRSVLIVDDEIQIRKGLRWKVDWEEAGFHIVAEAANGEGALAKLEEEKVDLVMTDIRMPIMDGIELARHCREKYPHVKVIVLSGYSDFEYVKSLMKKGVRDYLLKPVDPDELAEVLRQMKEEIDQDRTRQLELDQVKRQARTQFQEVQEQYLLSLVKEEWFQYSLVKERLEQLKLDMLLKEDLKVQFISVGVRDFSGQANRVNELRMAFQMLCKELVEQRPGIFAFYDLSYTNMMHFLIVLDQNFDNHPDRLTKMIQHQINKLLKLETVIGTGNPVTGLSELKTGYISSLLAWSQNQLNHHSQVINEHVKREELMDFSPDLEKHIINAIEQMDMSRFQRELESLLGETTAQSVLSSSIVANRILFCLGSIAKKYNVENSNAQQLIWECQQVIWQLNDQGKVIAYLTQLAELIVAQIYDTRSTDGRQIVDGVRRYIDQYYGNDISLTILSELFHINSAYLSEIFKAQIGKNFSEYLTEVRMKEAKKFLKDPHLKIIDVANLVGFSSSSYFSIVFKKHVNETPANYRKSLDIE
ncbi:response regulator [Oceanobacillus sojae]|uniref:response regulator transcription factor n=1 Tax=Oceanobacillus sojae TaxID=582851 RepID=UPI0021A840F2|nr:response regulator [Oceanobacillus sojae]MCT1902375.1 response regulator [Oceanobacillus sojae]